LRSEEVLALKKAASKEAAGGRERRSGRKASRPR